MDRDIFTQKDKILGRLGTVLATNQVATLAAILFFCVFSTPTTSWSLIQIVFYSVVYSNCIGTPIILSFPYLVSRSARWGFPRNWLLVLTALFVITLVGCLFAGVLLLGLGVYTTAQYWDRFYVCLRVSLVISAIFGITMFIYNQMRFQLAETLLQLRTRELEQERALKLATEARLAMLATQIHPHFLFNTLNSISALIQEDPAQAERLVERLAALLRYSLDANQRRLVPLRQELKIVTDYLEIEKARYGERLDYTIDVPGQYQLVEVPPLSTQTLVENSIKHSIAPRRKGGRISVQARLVDSHLQIAVWDDGPGFSVEKIIPGHGLDNLQARLAALFNKDASLAVAKRNDGQLVTIKLPCYQTLTAKV
ncbi:MAG: histidine kinase [Acidobacteriota bacterium]